jgi:DNA-3-methyladenine glycosylase I
MNLQRCQWVTKDSIYQDYHDNEWGIPVHNDQKLFEALILDTFQAGLSWLTILKKRENFREAFDQFNADKIAQYNENDVEKLMNNSGIIRNRLKIKAAISNAKCYLEVKKEFGSFDKYIWQFVSYQTIVNHREKLSDYPTQTTESDNMSKDMKKRGFKFCGTTICYAFMQAVGLVNDHQNCCFKAQKKGLN